MPGMNYYHIENANIAFKYRIVGNFHMVQNFAVIADKSAAAKIRLRIFLVLVMDC